MEISRRHLQDTERTEHDKLRDLLIADGNLVPNTRLAEVLEKEQRQSLEIEGHKLRAAEMQRQVDGLTRNQRRVLNKRMRKAAKK